MGKTECGGFEDFGRGPRRRATASELEEVFGPVTGASVNAELRAVDDEPPWQWVGAGDVAVLMDAYRRARHVADELRRALEVAGVVEHEQPELCVSIDAQGRPAIVLRAMSVSAAERLRRALIDRGRAA